MAIKTIDDTILTNIADAIREKGRTEEDFYPHEMPQAIRNIETGETSNLTNVTVTPQETSQTINPVAPYDGFNRVYVNRIPTQYKRLDTHTSALSNHILQGKTAYNSNGEFLTGTMVDNGILSQQIRTKNEEIEIPQGYTGGGVISIDTLEKGKIISENIKRGVTILGVEGSASSTPTLQDVTVKSTDTTQTVTAESGYDGIRQITVSPIDLETKTVKSTTSSQTVLPTSGKDGISEITVSPISLQDKTVTPTSSQQTITADSGYDGLGSVVVGAGGSARLQAKSVTPTDVRQTVLPDTGYDGLSRVVVQATPSLSSFFEAATTLPSYAKSADNPYKNSSIIECYFPLLQSIDCQKTFPALMGMTKLKAVHFGNSFVSLTNYRYASPFPLNFTTIYVPTGFAQYYRDDSNWADIFAYNPQITIVEE